MSEGTEIVCNEVRAKKLVLTDDEGRKRAELASTEYGGFGLTIFDSEGNRRAEFSHSDEHGTRIQFQDRTSMRMLVRSNAQGDAEITAYDGHGNRRISLTAGTNGAAFLNLHDRNAGLPRISIAATTNYACHIIMFDDAGNHRIVEHVSPGGEGTVGFYDGDGRLFGLLP